MQCVLLLEKFPPELEHTSGSIVDHIAALHALGVEIVVSVGGKGRVLADCLEDRNIPYRVTYSDVSVEGQGQAKHDQPLAGTSRA